MPAVLVLTHSPTASAGWLGPVLEEAGAAVRLVRLHEGETPQHRAEDAVVVLGGSMGAYDEGEHPFLAGEKRFLRDLVADDVPVLGICLGSQLLADALGGKAYLADVPEVGYSTPRRTEEGAAHPVLSALDEPVLILHQDTFTLPPAARLLASTDGYPQAFAMGSALAFQFHAEAGPDIVAGWMQRPGLRDLVRRAGRDPDQLVAEARRRERQAGGIAHRLFTAWARYALP